MPLHAVRLPANPIITQEMDPSLGDSINGPSLIRVPDWLPKPLGRYYLYFAHHQGTNIRLAYADAVEGPWRLHLPGSLQLADTPYGHHIASPDVHVDEATRTLRMYFHGCRALGTLSYGQTTMLATSTDGIGFTPLGEELGASYWRVFQHGGWYYAVEMPFHAPDQGMKIRRSRDGISGWELHPKRFFTVDFRHPAVKVDGDVLTLLWSDANEAPEHLKYCRWDLRRDWLDWEPGPVHALLQPERVWEGVEAPHLPSRRGSVHVLAWQLRDPAIFREAGRDYLIYAAGGEHSLAIAALHDDGQD